MLKVGSKAPNFSAVDQDGKEVSLKDLRGKKVVLYFYCKDSTSGCTTESVNFAKNYWKFTMRNARIVGMCLGTVASHKKFARDCNLPFDLWLDKGVKVAKKIGIWKEKSLYGRKYFGIERTTFVLDEKGKITKIFPKVKVDGHWKDVLESLSL